MMKRFVMVLAIFAALALALPAMAADVKIKGDFNNRFMVYTDHNDWLTMEDGGLDDGSVDESWGEAKYRMWVEASTNDGKVKGVWAIEVGALHYGNESYRGEGAGGYSGDGVVIENRWMYTDFQLPWCENKAMIRMGLQPFSANSFYWQETVMGVKFSGSVNNVDYELAWLRPWEDQVYNEDDDAEDMDAFYGRVNFKPADGLKMGVFAVYHTGDSDNPGTGATITSQNYEIKGLQNDFETQIFTIGTDGSWAKDAFFAKWDFMYQTGSIDDANFQDAYDFNADLGPQFIDYAGPVVASEDFDLDAYFLHADLGYKMDAWKFTYTFWYASGDDDADDDDLEGFMAVDLDRMDNICIFEGGFTDDDYFTEKPYLLDKGFIMNKLAVDYKANKKTTMGASFMYMMTAEDVEYIDNDGKSCDDDSIGFEVDAYLKYKIYDNLEFAVNAGYLFADDAMDYYEVERDGDSDEDIFISTARVRYKF